MIEGVLDAFLDVLGNALDGLLTEFALDDVAAEGQRQSCLLLPPFPEIEDLVQTHLAVRQLAFVDQQSGFVLAALNIFEYLIERHNMVLDLRLEETKRQEGCRQRAGNGYGLAGE